MPLLIEQESQQLLQTALDRLRKRMDAYGGYEQNQDIPFDALDRVIGSALSRGDYSQGIQEATAIAPDLFNVLLGRQSERLDNLNYRPTEGRDPNAISGPIQLPGGELGRVLGDQWIPVMRQPEAQPRPITPSWALPSLKGDVGFSYLGAPEGEEAAREAWRLDPKSQQATEGARKEVILNDLNRLWNTFLPPPEPVRGTKAGDDEAFQGALEFLSRGFEEGKTGTDIVRSLPPELAGRLTTAQLNSLIRMATIREARGGLSGLWGVPEPTGANISPSSARPSASSSDRILVISPSGKRGSIPRSQLEEALKAGYRQP